MVLSHSRYKYGYWQDKPFNAQDFVDVHDKAFQYFDGIPEEIVYDRTKVALINENKDGTFKLCKTFKEYVKSRECLNLCVNLSNFSRLIDLIFFTFNTNIFFRILRI